MSLYLMADIGIKGGVAVAKSGIDATVPSALAVGIVAGFILPFFAYGVLKTFGKLDRINSGAVAAHYGSISVVTFPFNVVVNIALISSLSAYLTSA